MLFNSAQFLIFLPAVLLFYYVLPGKVRYLWLLAASYYFYMCWNAKYALLMLFSTLVTWLCGLALERVKKQGRPSQAARKKLCVAASLVLNFGVLALFKYADFVLGNLNVLLSRLHIGLTLPASSGLLLPVGISFYTFQAVGYTIDVYRDDIYAEKNFFRYALFVSFFPQLVAGPIERSKNLLKQLAVPHKPSSRNMQEGMLLMLWGYFLKVVLADRIAVFVDAVYGDIAAYGGWYLAVATLLFSIQIYCDFAGYSTIAMGAAKMLGIQLMENFQSPYLSQSVSEFWRRWHISLSTWFRDYLYIPLGGNRRGRWRKYLNLIITFGVSGLWHGASWAFVAWGLLNGLYQVAGDLLKPVRQRLCGALHLHSDTLGHKALRIGVTYSLICLSWVLFRSNGLKASLDIFHSIFHAGNPHVLFDGSLYTLGLTQKDFSLLLAGIALLAAVDICKYRGLVLREGLLRQDAWVRCVVIAVAVCLVLLFGMWGASHTATSFLYFQF